MTEAEETRNPPVEVLRDGNIKASIWRNKNREGDAYYNTTFTRTYRDEKGVYRETHSFSGTDLLKLSELSRRAYEQASELRQERPEKMHQGTIDRPDAPKLSRERGRDREHGNEL